MIAISEEGDTVAGLGAQGIDIQALAGLANQAGIPNVNRPLTPGIAIDITHLLPESVQTAIAAQQNMDYELLRPRIENTPGGKKNVRKGCTLGTSGVNLAQPNIEADTGAIVSRKISDDRLGLGNCHGFTCMMLGVIPPKGVGGSDFAVGAIKGEPHAIEGRDKPGLELSIAQRPWGKFPYAWYFPKGGLFRFLTDGRIVTNSPCFGDVAIFRNLSKNNSIQHSAFVLGRSQDGTVYIIQKLRDSMAIVITPATHPVLDGAGRPTYYTPR